ncbi:MAG: hypothetical protein LIO42_01875, partial [Oscillospiraceae bacterium]|nr:hypothetical protein [Oscillospiraceae bacterium]
MKKHVKRTLVAWILTLAMLLSMLPTAAFASKAGEESAAGESTEEVQAEESADGAAESEQSGEEIEEADISAVAEESLAVHAVLQGSGAALLSDGIPNIVTVYGETVTEDAGVSYSFYGIYGHLRFNVEVTEDGLLDIYAGNHTLIWSLYLYSEEDSSWHFLATMDADEVYEGLAVSPGTYYFYTQIWDDVTTTPISVTLYEPSVEGYSIHVDTESGSVAVGEQTSLAFELYRDGAPLKSDDYYYDQSYWVTLSDYSYDVFRTCYSTVEKPNGETYYGDVIESYDEDGNCIGCGLTLEAVGSGTLTVTVTELNTGVSQEVELSAYIAGYSLQVESTSRDCSAEVGDDVVLSFTLLLNGEGVEFSDFLCTFSWDDGTEESEVFSCDGEVLLSADGDENWLYRRSYQFTAANAGSTVLNVTVSLFDLSVDGYWRDVVSASLVLTAYEDSKMYFNEVPVLNTDSDGTKTNFLGGLDVDDFRYSQNEDGSYDVSMTVYNPQDIYGAVTVYD